MNESKSLGFAALDNAISMLSEKKLSRSEKAKANFERSKGQRVADRDWFEKNKPRVEMSIGECIRLDKRQLVGAGIEIQKQDTQFEQVPLESYQPPVEDEEYVPKAQRTENETVRAVEKVQEQRTEDFECPFSCD
ncbi:MAG: hypothetical protein JKY53_00070 [Flavobacteriales bacterium]|nr:hypothetical protein [Flavobacteriales bacterium]